MTRRDEIIAGIPTAEDLDLIAVDQTGGPAMIDLPQSTELSALALTLAADRASHIEDGDSPTPLVVRFTRSQLMHGHALLVRATLDDDDVLTVTIKPNAALGS